MLAGVNGAGKSSIAGSALRSHGADYFDPDQVTRDLRQAEPELSLEAANVSAWRLGRRLLERAIAERRRFAFETTLGGRTITGLLLKAANVGLPVRVLYIGLESADLHVRRVRARARRGGHDIPEDRIRQRYTSSRANLIRLLPHLAELRVLDNTEEADPATGDRPEPEPILHLKAGRLLYLCPLADVPGWAKPIVQATLESAIVLPDDSASLRDEMEDMPPDR